MVAFLVVVVACSLNTHSLTQAVNREFVVRTEEGFMGALSHTNCCFCFDG